MSTKEIDLGQFPEDHIPLSNLVESRLSQLGIQPNENLGQHFLVDGEALQLLVGAISPGNKVLEVGAGIGQLTEALAVNATRVDSIEIDRRFEPILAELGEKYPNLHVIYGDVLAFNLSRFVANPNEMGTQIIASIPYHITEPFMHKVASLPIESATMVVGKKLAESILAPNEESLGFGKLTLLSQSFFDADVIEELGRESFFPQPRTESAIIQLNPKEGRETMRDFLLRKLFTTAHRSPLVGNCLKEGLTEYTEKQELGLRSKGERNKISRRSTKFALKLAMDEYNQQGVLDTNTDKNGRAHLLRAGERAIIGGLGIPSDILQKPFDRLNNTELRVLSAGLRGNGRF